MTTDQGKNKKKIFVHARPLLNFYLDTANRNEFPWREKRSDCLYFTSNLVLSDFFKNLGRKVGCSYAGDVAQNILRSDSIEILRASLDNERQALQYFKKFGDKEISFTNSVSHVLRLAYQIDTHVPFAEEIGLPPYGQATVQEELNTKPGCPILHSFWSKVSGGARPHSSSRPKLFIDTGAFVAKFSKRDGDHELAEQLWKEVASSNYVCYTSNFVLEEFFSMLAIRVSYKYAHDVASLFLQSNPFIILRPDKQTELSAANEFQKHKRISFTDCVSFTLMRAHGIKQAFTFDCRDFKGANFSIFGYNSIDSTPKRK